jgi:hypothetical protein
MKNLTRFSKSKFTLTVTALLFAVVACKKIEIDQLSKTVWNPNLAVPLAFSTLECMIF